MIRVEEHEPVDALPRIRLPAQPPCPCRERFVGLAKAIALDPDDAVDCLIYAYQDVLKN